MQANVLHKHCPFTTPLLSVSLCVQCDGNKHKQKRAKQQDSDMWLQRKRWIKILICFLGQMLIAQPLHCLFIFSVILVSLWRRPKERDSHALACTTMFSVQNIKNVNVYLCVCKERPFKEDQMMMSVFSLYIPCRGYSNLSKVKDKDL